MLITIVQFHMQMCIRDRSKGKGYSGTIVRNNAARGPMTHGSGHHRHIGSLATNGRNNGVVNKGTVMPVSYTHLDVYKRQGMH